MIYNNNVYYNNVYNNKYNNYNVYNNNYNNYNVYYYNVYDNYDKDCYDNDNIMLIIIIII